MHVATPPALPSWQHLPTGLQTRLPELLDQYACSLEAGDEASAERLLQQHPELSEHLHGHLESLRLLCRPPQQTPETPDRIDFAKQLPEIGPTGNGPQSQLGDYRIEREIGRGGMGVVYAATQLSLRRSVALKVLPFAAVLDQQQVTRFRNEAQAAASLHHPNIVPVFAVGCERGVHYYSMQLIDGQTLEQAIKEMRNQQKSRPLSQLHHAEDAFAADDLSDVAFDTTIGVTSDAPNGSGSKALSRAHSNGTSQALAQPSRSPFASTAINTAETVRNRDFVRSTVQIIIDVAEALDYAHQQGVVHRDIKPSNLLVDAAGKVWVADFGLARCRGVNNLTAHGNIIGTARYMSPEQVAGRSQEVDHRTDIYSLGITLYELLTLQPAFAASNREQLLGAIESHDPPSLRRLNPAISVDLETIVCKAIAKSKDERYATAGELAEDLRRFLDGRPTLARRPTLVDRAFKWAMRRQGLVCSALAISLTLAIAMSVGMLLVSRQSKLKDEATVRAQMHLDQAHHAVDRFSGKFLQRLAKIPGTDQLQADVLHEAERYYLDFLRYAKQNRHMQSELARVRYRLGALQTRLGKFADAEQHYQQAITDFTTLTNKGLANSKGLANKGQSNELDQADLALCFHNLAALRKDQGRYSDALVGYQKAAKLLETQLADDKPPARVFRQWATTQTNLGALLWICGEAEQADRLLIDLQQQLENVSLRHGQDRGVRQQLFECRNARVAMLLDSDPDQAETLLQANISELESWNLPASDGEASLSDDRLAAGQPSPQCQLAIARNNLATLWGQRGDVTQAIELVRASITTLEHEAAQFGDAAAVQQQLAVAHNNLGQLLWNRQPNELATQQFVTAEAILRRDLASETAPADTLSRLAGVLHNRSVIDQHQGEMEKAVQHLTEAMEFQSLAVRKAPYNAAYRECLENHREQLDQILHQIQDQSGTTSLKSESRVSQPTQRPNHPPTRPRDQEDSASEKEGIFNGPA
ncbi:protein kinase domain-containing protein [Novipirellula rosea]|uniref:Protein kinase domain-containing protein n=1 Tax=Novipirellula rosea TaxID=1031540 RepID=A0ABP8MIV6_9BACT